jgi:hypothetical protein
VAVFDVVARVHADGDLVRPHKQVVGEGNHFIINKQADKSILLWTLIFAGVCTINLMFMFLVFTKEIYQWTDIKASAGWGGMMRAGQTVPFQILSIATEVRKATFRLAGEARKRLSNEPTANV